MNSLSVLQVVKAVNTGILVWDQVGGLVQEALESGRDVSIADIDAAAGVLDTAQAELLAAILEAEARGE